MEPEPDSFARWSRFLVVLLRSKWLILAVVILGCVAGVAATHLVHPMYRAYATIWISTHSDHGRESGPIRGEQLLQPTAWISLLNSFAILDPVVREMSLYLAPADIADSNVFRGFGIQESFRPGRYALKIDDGARRYTLLRRPKSRLSVSRFATNVVETGAVGDSVGRAVGFRWLPEPVALKGSRTITFSVIPPRDASVQLSNRLSATLPENSNLLRLALTGDDPRRTAATLNTLARRLVSVAADLKRSNLVDLSQTLEEQTRHAASELREAEQALRAGYASAGSTAAARITSAGVERATASMLDDLMRVQVEEENTRRDRQALEFAADPQRPLDVQALWMIPAVQAAPPGVRNTLEDFGAKQADLRATQRLYAESHPNVRVLREALDTMRMKTIPGHLRSMILQLRRRETELGLQKESVSRALSGLPARSLQESRLQRSVQLKENVYRMLQSRYEEARLANASTQPDIRILDAAVAPETPSRNTAVGIMLPAIALSVGIAVLLALLRDRLDATVRYPEQVSQGLGLNLVGTVPRLKSAGNPAAEMLRSSDIVESFRLIRLNLGYAFGAAVPMFTVTSPGEGEGKSLACANLALSFAGAGIRTLLIDGDVRRGEMHKAFGIDRMPGLVDYLAGDVTLAEATRDQGQTLSLIPCGVRRANAPELLSSSAMTELVNVTRGRFDVVIVDSPPLDAGIDPLVLSAATGHLLLIFRIDKSDSRRAAAALDLIDRLPIRVLGAVINEVPRRLQPYQHRSGRYVIQEEVTA